ncbi:MogA/MoaB family molybdenum cofactor biosynthesis protein [Listeria ilorinensis]|uniref:MogA/MoaB family molybdenum cofactor biosynthesis protein n=1 Tax=Listeria ilorinensis TaxID=2867439 RepID=UPI001EF59168|nr:MogA/MoaB family molybdenum cofactor biosynthesis protein [Listeria ilorinensis]
MEITDFHAVRCAILTISDTRSLENDQSGKYLAEKLTEHQHHLVEHAICRDEPDQINHQINRLLEMQPFCLITTGGTGLAKRDVTYETLRQRIKQEIPGFGELFRMLSYKEVGSRAMVSRAFAGFTEENVLLFVLPGSKNACQTALENLILPELPHLFVERTKKG